MKKHLSGTAQVQMKGSIHYFTSWLFLVQSVGLLPVKHQEQCCYFHCKWYDMHLKHKTATSKTDTYPQDTKSMDSLYVK